LNGVTENVRIIGTRLGCNVTDQAGIYLTGFGSQDSIVKIRLLY